jgi:hypothetical protein
MEYQGTGSDFGSLAGISGARSRSLSAENSGGEKGKGGMALPGPNSHAAGLGQGWKASPCVTIEAGTVYTIGDIEGPGAIKHIWISGKARWRFAILRFYWDGQDFPSVEAPIGDFFASCWEGYAQLSSLAVCVNPRSGYNCYWDMPFNKRCRISIENLDAEPMVVFYQVDYALGEVPENYGYFHASFRRENPLPYKEVYTILDGVQGRGHYVGTCLAWGVHSTGWWGEGEVKFYLDGDEWPTICGTGLEDYFGGSYNFDVNGRYTPFSTPYSGMHQVISPDGLYNSQQRFGMYRWHISDPVRFEEDLRVTVQALGYRKDQFLPLQDDIASVAYWYQTLPGRPLKALPPREKLFIY